MGRQFFYWGEGAPEFFFTVPLICFFISSTSAPKNKSKRRALFSECAGAYERLLWYGWVWGWEGKKITVYTLQKTLQTTPLLADPCSRVQIRWVCWPIKHSNTMVIEPAFGTFGSVGRCQVLLENKTSISINTRQTAGCPSDKPKPVFQSFTSLQFTNVQIKLFVCLAVLV